nr:uncharacterized protein LOC112750461 [Arachis hypogaea]
MAASFLPLPALLALTYMLISRTWILMFLHNFLSMTNVLSSTDVITHFITTITLRPEKLALELKHSFKIVVADPPYLMLGSSNTLIWYSSADQLLPLLLRKEGRQVQRRQLRGESRFLNCPLET